VLEPVDKIPPKVAVTSPDNGTGSIDTVMIKVTATDESGIRYVSIFIDGKEMAGSKDSLEPYAFPWNTLIYEDNSNHEIKSICG